MSASSGPTLDQVLEKLRQYLEGTAKSREESTCPFTPEERDLFIQHYSKSFLEKCPAFFSHQCPFVKLKNYSQFEEIMHKIPRNKLSECPVMHLNHPNPHGKLVDQVQKELEGQSVNKK
ncbi:hypothetical protein FDP41_005934 [Naegleria fowleri]|uniref:Uncharacterized protein n=1 Tax=Naegleria fowleri TaxID=5763 RepID=A0A6A5BLF5_NAEFO|nr:uncharacterized protein FDP41_005934 [Naegleria fowleri]KAF0975181.1 hypothetical protein FDP41_005934 [Naegleria fowleri]CAG4717469.1 unnamed protein product [Naegleria fowleri]